MKIDITQVWEYEFKPTDTMRLLHAFKNIWETQGDEIALERRGGSIYAVRKSKTEQKPNTMEEHYRKLREYYDNKYLAYKVVKEGDTVKVVPND